MKDGWIDGICCLAKRQMKCSAHTLLLEEFKMVWTERQLELVGTSQEVSASRWVAIAWVITVLEVIQYV